MTQELHPEAELELLEAAHWYGERSVRAGSDFVTAMELAFGIISESPERFQRVGKWVVKCPSRALTQCPSSNP